uniref:Olfactory receptor family 2 subfamily V member 1 n=1 Tax=Monodon monoceros TaxID=40151 RepID=A0A8C6ATV9_MONMO
LIPAKKSQCHMGKSIDGFILLGIFSHSQTDLALFSVVMVVSTVALCGNALLIFLIYIDPRTPMYFFLSHLSLMDLMLVCATVPKMVANFSLAENPSPLWLLPGLMAYDCYVAISHPLHYPILMSQRVCLQVAGSSWTLGIIGGMMQMAGAMSLPYCGSRNVDHFFCEVPALLKLACADTSIFDTLKALILFFACYVFMLLLPFSIIVASYAHLRASALPMHTAQAHKKALATCSSHLTAVSLFYGAAMFIYLRPRRYQAPILTPMLNPLIYSLRNREVMGALKKGKTIRFGS